MPSSRFIALRSRAALLCFLLTTIVGVTLDQWSKKAAFNKLSDGVEWQGDHVFVRAARTYQFIPGWLHFEDIGNRGAVFGVGQGKQTLFISVSAAAILFILYLFSVSGRQRFYQVILGMLLAGVLGNLYDRATFGYVRDMIHMVHTFPIWPYSFPYIFNVADSLLCCGVGLMVIHSFIHSPDKANAAQVPG